MGYVSNHWRSLLGSAAAPAGNVVSLRNRAGQTTTVTYDALNRPTYVDRPAGTSDADYHYDNLGRVWGLSSTFWILNGWDALSRQTVESSPLGAMAYQYDAAGRLTRITWPDGVFAQ